MALTAAGPAEKAALISDSRLPRGPLLQAVQQGMVACRYGMDVRLVSTNSSFHRLNRCCSHLGKMCSAEFTSAAVNEVPHKKHLSKPTGGNGMGALMGGKTSKYVAKRPFRVCNEKSRWVAGTTRLRLSGNSQPVESPLNLCVLKFTAMVVS